MVLPEAAISAADVIPSRLRPRRRRYSGPPALPERHDWISRRGQRSSERAAARLHISARKSSTFLTEAIFARLAFMPASRCQDLANLHLRGRAVLGARRSCFWRRRLKAADRLFEFSDLFLC